MTMAVSEPDFVERRRVRDESILEVVRAAAAALGLPPDTVHFHCKDYGGCFCACPEGPCEHQFGGWREFEDGRGGESVCALCGLGAMAHDIATGP